MKWSSLVVLLVLALMYPSNGHSQGKTNRRKPVKTGNSDINQWWIGVRGGVNLSHATAQESYSVFSFTRDFTDGDNEKNYHAFTLPGLQFGFSVSYEFLTGLSVNILPAYVSYRYSYDNSFRWYDSENQNNNVTTGHNIETRLQYIDLPLTFKYELLRGAFKPYVQIGGYSGYLTDAIKKAKITSVDQASGADREINVTDLSVGVEDRIKKWNYGIIGGIGFTYNVGNARLGLEVNHRYGLQNLDNGGMKFVDNQLITGTYDVPDDFSLSNLELSMQVIIPLKFITSKDYIPL